MDIEAVCAPIIRRAMAVIRGHGIVPDSRAFFIATAREGVPELRRELRGYGWTDTEIEQAVCGWEYGLQADMRRHGYAPAMRHEWDDRVQAVLQ